MFSPSSLFDLFCENERKGGNKTNKQKAQQIKTLFWRARYVGNLKRELKVGSAALSVRAPPPATGWGAAHG